MEHKRPPTQPDKVDGVAAKFFDNASAKRINTDVYLYNAIKEQHPGVEVLDVMESNCNFRNYIEATGDGEIEVLTEKHLSWASSLKLTSYIPPFRRMDGDNGAIAETAMFDKYKLTWKKNEFLIYIVDGRDGTALYYDRHQFVLGDKSAAYLLMKAVGNWQSVLHDELWVFSQGFWQKDSLLYRNIMKSRWEDVILDKDLKEELLGTITRFFDSKEQYDRLRVPWKRGIIFYGPPGNGKTISIKATMHSLYQRKKPIPSLYVKSLQSFGGPEYSITQIFLKARQQAPCYLVFEDLDSMVTDQVRSFFLNAVDGLAENEGILMIGSTNHLERLDPGIAKRPSRFDRKYLFPEPDFEQRVKYCHFWQNKLKDNKDIEFPDKLCPEIARITDKFSFAYMQEAFVSALLAIANSHERDHAAASSIGEEWDVLDGVDSGDEDLRKEKDLDKYVLWREIQAQVRNLRKELGEDDGSRT